MTDYTCDCPSCGRKNVLTSDDIEAGAKCWVCEGGEDYGCAERDDEDD